jgi:hypothetical protein
MSKPLGSFLTPILLIAILIFAVVCKTPEELEDPPIITSASYQHTQYNGRRQAVEVSTAKDNVPPVIVTYFRSEAELEQNRNGSAEAPFEVGDYYARIERPGGNGYRRGADVKIEYHIQKAFISIIADPLQRFAYDGEPKEITVQTEPPVGLVVSYFAAGDLPIAALPSERGHYRVLIVFPGNDRHMGASKEVELWIE